ncbi:MAG TPA: LapA family protein [Allosphingosinicella sp.]|nr:LapA family protein [Allosphingosinicella sp.]
MQFLKTLFWIVLTVVLVLFAKANWTPVTLRLWGGLEADVKLPVLVLFAFLLGFLPTLILYRTRLWGLRRRVEPAERSVGVVPAPAAHTPTIVDNGVEGRVATDSKAWPAT